MSTLTPPEHPRLRPPAERLRVDQADEDNLRDALAGLSFPADRVTALTYATDRVGSSDRLIDLLHAAPDRVFSSVDDLVISLPDTTPLKGTPRGEETTANT